MVLATAIACPARASNTEPPLHGTSVPLILSSYWQFTRKRGSLNSTRHLIESTAQINCGFCSHVLVCFCDNRQLCAHRLQCIVIMYYCMVQSNMHAHAVTTRKTCFASRSRHAAVINRYHKYLLLCIIVTSFGCLHMTVQNLTNNQATATLHVDGTL